jgi:hypothetical protein
MVVPNVKLRRRFDSLPQSVIRHKIFCSRNRTVQNEQDWYNFLANSTGNLFLYRLNCGTFICFLPFSRISFSSILIDLSVDILPLHSYFLLALKNLCKCHSERAFTREQQLKLWPQLPTAMFQHLFKSASDVTADRQSVSMLSHSHRHRYVNVCFCAVETFIEIVYTLAITQLFINF